MATSNSLDKVLCTDVDPSAVTAIVGSLETQLAASAKTAANQPVNASVNGGINSSAAAVVEGRANGGKIGVRGPAVSSGAVFAGKVVSSSVGSGPGGGAAGAGAGAGGGGQALQAAGGETGVVVVQGGPAAPAGAALQGSALAHHQQLQQQQQASSSSSSSPQFQGAAGVKPVYGAAPTPMTGTQGTQVVNGGVAGAGTGGGAPQVSLQAQLALKGLTKVVTAAAAAGVSAGQTAVIMSKPGTVAAVPSTGTPGAVTIPPGMQIINMRPGQPMKTTQGTTIAPRMILNPAQVLPTGIRPGQPGADDIFHCPEMPSVYHKQQKIQQHLMPAVV